MKDRTTNGGYKSERQFCGAFFFKVGGKNPKRQRLEREEGVEFMKQQVSQGRRKQDHEDRENTAFC